MSATEWREACVHCGAPPHKGASPYCSPCGEAVRVARLKVRYEIVKAQKSGLLPNAKTLVCVDCGKPAFDYDHRDYSKPLSVEPVCRRCNQLRGPAIIDKYRALFGAAATAERAA